MEITFLMMVVSTITAWTILCCIGALARRLDYMIRLDLIREESARRRRIARERASEEVDEIADSEEDEENPPLTMPIDEAPRRAA